MCTLARCRLWFVCFAVWFTAALSQAGQPQLTFFGWSDQHVQTSGDARHLEPAIEAMNALPGTKYPEAIGGTVDAPAFVFGAGDITEWPTNAARTQYEKLITEKLKFPAYDIAGNHDTGGKVPSETITKWLAARHGGLSYKIEQGGVVLLAVHSKYDEMSDSPAQPIHKDALEYIKAELKKIGPDKPVIVALHLCYEAITNRDELVQAFEGYKVILVLGGHYHRSTVHKHRGIPFVQLPSPAPNGPREFTVIRITADRLVAIPYNYQNKQWNTAPGKVLDVPLK